MQQVPTKDHPLENDDIVDHARCVPASAMTLRDYFAAKVMQAFMIAAAQKTDCSGDAIMNISHLRNLYADEAYLTADTMVAVRDVP